MANPNSGFVLGIDLGTTNYKACLYTADGTLAGTGSAPVNYDTDDAGKVELPVERCLQLVRSAIEAAAEEAKAELSQVQAIAYSTQANTFLLADEHAQPLTPLVVWIDHRTRQFPDDYQAIAATEEFLQVVGFNTIAPGMMVANIDWFRQHQPDTWAAARYIMTLPDYIVYLLTGSRIGDSGSCALLGLWDIRGNQWWDKALNAADISEEQLPRLLYPGSAAGHVSRAGSELFGLPCGIPVVVGSLDHHVAAIGAGAGKTAPFSVSTGTVLCATCLDDRYEVDPKLCMGPGMNGKGYYRIAWHNHGTRALNWYRDKYAPDHSIEQLLQLASAVPADVALPGVTLCPWEQPADPGFADGHGAEDHGLYTRAILCSMVDLLDNMLQSLQPDLVPQGIVVTGGGARCAFWMQMIADRINAPVYRSASSEAGCLGAAVLAAVGAEWYHDIEEASAAMVRISDCIQPGGHAETTPINQASESA